MVWHSNSSLNSKPMTSRLNNSEQVISDEVATAIAERRPVVALETTLVTHGLPQPDGVRVAVSLEDIVRQSRRYTGNDRRACRQNLRRYESDRT